MSRQLPHDLGAERSLLGSVLLDASALDMAVSLGIDAGDFYMPLHGRLFAAMARLRNAGQPLDLTTLDDGTPGTASAADLGELQASTPTAANARTYADRVLDRAQLRRFILTASEHAARAYEADDADEFLEAAEAAVLAVRRQAPTHARHVREWLGVVMNRIEARTKNQRGVTGVPTGFVDLDELTAGLQPSELILLGARPSVGKTALAASIAIHAAAQGVPVLFLSLEMSGASIVERMLAMQAHVEASMLRVGRLGPDGWDRLTPAASELARRAIYIDDDAAPTIGAIRAKARRFRANRSLFAADDALGLMVVDYLQLARGEQQRGRSREEEVASISRGLKALAKELRLPVLALSQLRRASEDRAGPPRLSDLRESGALEQDADVVMFLHRETTEDNRATPIAEPTDLIIAKQRNGPTSVVKLVFLRQFTRFETRAK